MNESKVKKTKREMVSRAAYIENHWEQIAKDLKGHSLASVAKKHHMPAASLGYWVDKYRKAMGSLVRQASRDPNIDLYKYQTHHNRLVDAQEEAGSSTRKMSITFIEGIGDDEHIGDVLLDAMLSRIQKLTAEVELLTIERDKLLERITKTDSSSSDIEQKRRASIIEAIHG